MLYTLLIYTLTLCVSLARDLCKTSRALVSEKEAYHSYPVKIYGNDAKEPNFVTHQCYAVQDADAHLPLECAVAGNSDLCPLKDRFVKTSLKAQESWINGSVLCNLYGALAEKDTSNKVNVIVLGGSVTAGVSTQGCCTRSECTKAEYYEINGFCNWTAYLGRWFSTFGPHVQTHNLAHAGYNSDTYKNKIVEKLATIRKNFSFRNSDLVLLDISVNDGNTFEGTPAKMIVLERGLEALIRRIYWLSEPQSMPTIVLLEFWIGNPSFLAETAYTKAYRKIAQHYNLTVWSYRDAVREMFVADSNDELMKHLSGWHNYGPSSGHPPWHVHMFYADYVSAAISKQLAMCGADKLAKRDTNAYPVIKSPQMLPPPLLPHKMHHCDANATPLLSITSTQAADASFTNHVQPKQPDSVPIFYSDPADAWQVMEDKKGRPGFIHDYKNGGGVSAGASAAPARIVFHLNITHEKFIAMREPQMMQILYLRTYQNAGIVSVFLCGNPLKDGRYEPVQLDALWADYGTFKFSLPEIYSMDLTKENCHPDVRKDQGSTHVTLELVHTHYPHGGSEEQTARGDQKFKLVEMKVCTLASGNSNRR